MTGERQLLVNQYESLVEQLFDRFQKFYGASAFLSKWEGIDPDELKRTWAKQLMKFHPQEIVRATGMLPEGDFPPALPVFCGICQTVRDINRAKMQANAPKLKHKIDPNDPEIVAARERVYETARKNNMQWVFKAIGGQA